MRPTTTMGAGLAALALIVVLFTLGCGGKSPSDIAKLAGANTCTSSGYWISDAYGKGKYTIYNCNMLGVGLECVIMQNSIPVDVTVRANYVFADVLGDNLPECAK